MTNAQFLEASGPVYTVPLSAVSLTTAETDLFYVTGSTNSRTVIRELRIGQYSEFGDAQAELLSIVMMTGSTAVSGGSTAAARNVRTQATAPQAEAEVLGPSATLGSTTSAEVRWADSWNVAAGLLYAPLPPERLVLEPGETYLVRLSAPADAVTLNATLTFQEIGK